MENLDLFFELGTEPITEYQPGTAGKPFDALAPGTFVDMYGRKVILDAADFAKIVENTRAAIESTATDSGVIVGLPIDQRNHDKGDAAGWIVSAELDGNKIRLTPRWNRVGLELIRNEVVRRFSATLNLAKKVILGGSLVNWPALVTEDGISQLRPIELAQASVVADEAVQNFPTEVKHMDENKIRDLISEGVREQIGSELAELKAAFVAAQKPVSATVDSAPADAAEDIMEFLELSGHADEIVQEVKDALLRQHDAMRDRARQEAQTMLRALRKEQTIAEFATRSTTGSDSTPFGIPVEIEDLKGWLMTLNSSQLEFAMNLLENIQRNGLISFVEFGHDKTNEGTEQLPPEISRALKTGELTVEDLSDDILALGDISRFNLSAWRK